MTSAQRSRLVTGMQRGKTKPSEDYPGGKLAFDMVDTPPHDDSVEIILDNSWNVVNNQVLNSTLSLDWLQACKHSSYYFNYTAETVSGWCTHY